VSAGDEARVLVLNCGSSSVKYRLVEPHTGSTLAWGMVERVGQAEGRLAHHWLDVSGVRAEYTEEQTYAEYTEEQTYAAHAQALDAVIDAFSLYGPDLGERLVAVGHRVVHGGERFAAPVVVDEDVLRAIDELATLAPLHNPANATGIRVARRRLPSVVHVAVFDTAFHATIPPEAATYALPREWRTWYGVRRYGFHGTSHAYVSRETARLLGRPVEHTNVIVLHLGNGASACAVRGGRSIDTSMGMTPLQGLVMSTRCGDVDPAVPGHLARVAGLTAETVDEVLNTQSGLLALAGASDLRDIIARAEAGDPDARLALDVYCYRVRSYVGAYFAALGRVDAVAFTAGVGENSPLVRERSLQGLDRLGIAVDPTLNHARPEQGASRGRVISLSSASVAVLVVPTDEEREIATQALRVVER
jgi:acetate kinase